MFNVHSDKTQGKLKLATPLKNTPKKLQITNKNNQLTRLDSTPKLISFHLINPFLTVLCSNVLFFLFSLIIFYNLNFSPLN